MTDQVLCLFSMLYTHLSKPLFMFSRNITKVFFAFFFRYDYQTIDTNIYFHMRVVRHYVFVKITYILNSCILFLSQVLKLCLKE